MVGNKIDDVEEDGEVEFEDNGGDKDVDDADDDNSLSFEFAEFNVKIFKTFALLCLISSKALSRDFL